MKTNKISHECQTDSNGVEKIVVTHIGHDKSTSNEVKHKFTYHKEPLTGSHGTSYNCIKYEKITSR